MQPDEPALILEYNDPIEGFKGWLVIDGLNHSLAAGGLRVQKSLTLDHLKKMARNMTKKMRVWGMPVNGAKSGLDYDPASPGKDAAVERFMVAIKPYMAERYSMGGDLNTAMPKLDEIARSIGLPSIKVAIANAQGLDLAAFEERYRILDEPVIGSWTLGNLRAGYAVGMAALAVLDYKGIPYKRAKVAVQGFGTLAKAALVGLQEAGATVKAIADAERCLMAETEAGLDLGSILGVDAVQLSDVAGQPGVVTLPSEAVLGTDVDVIVLAAIENAITADNAPKIRARSVVPGANLAVTTAAEEALHEKGVEVLPCFVAGSGGSVAMNGLFGPAQPPAARDVLDYVRTAMSAKIRDILRDSATQGLTPTQVAEQLVAEDAPVDRTRPYGM
jgi:glutamate dehydrogenase (NAD(P)+)